MSFKTKESNRSDPESVLETWINTFYEWAEYELKKGYRIRNVMFENSKRPEKRQK